MKYMLFAFFMILVSSIAAAQDSGMSFPERSTETQSRYEIRSRLPELTDEIAMNYPVEVKDSIANQELQKLQRSLQTRSQFGRMPEQNTWAVIGVLAAIVITIIVIRVAYSGS
jgi:hypothetical protein